MRVTQQDIARIAKVSQATVSRVLAGDVRVEARIRDRVQGVILEHNYRPDVRARSLRSKRTGLIGLVVKRPPGGLKDDPFFSNLTAEIMDFLSGKPYHLCVDMVTSDIGQEAIYDEMLRTRRVDGLILVESEASDERIHRLQAEGFPFVLIGNPMSGNGATVMSVDNDNFLAGEMATRHLLDQGYGRVGIIAGPKGLTVSNDRIAGYCAAIGDRECEPLVWHSEFGAQATHDVACRILSAPGRPDGLVVLDDFMAMGVVLACRSLGIRIPEDLGVVSFNDSSICQLIESGLSSVSLNIPEIVRIATGNLLRIIEQKNFGGPRRVIVPCELMARGSSRRKGAGR